MDPVAWRAWSASSPPSSCLLILQRLEAVVLDAKLVSPFRNASARSGNHFNSYSFFFLFIYLVMLWLLWLLLLLLLFCGNTWGVLAFVSHLLGTERQLELGHKKKVWAESLQWWPPVVASLVLSPLVEGSFRGHLGVLPRTLAEYLPL